VTVDRIRYATPADAVAAARQSLKRMLVRRTANTEALLDVDIAGFTIGDRVDEAAIRAWVEANSTLPERIRTHRIDGQPTGGELRFQSPAPIKPEEGIVD
jgi:hypothetical protein